MAKSTKKSAPKKVLIKSRKINFVQLGVFLLGLILLGVLITRLFAASADTTTPQRIGQLSLRYDEEVPQVEVKAADGTVTYPSAAYTIDVATDGTLYCLPANSGTGSTRLLSQAEFRTLRRKILNLKVVQEWNEQVKPDVMVNNKPIFTIANDAGDKLEIAVANDLQKSPRFQAAAQIMKNLCDTTGQPIARRKKPTFVPAVLGTLSPSPSPLSINPIEYFRTALLPTAYALSLDQAVADSQLFLLNSTRSNHGLAPLSKYYCLTDIANGWSVHLALLSEQGMNGILEHNHEYLNKSASACNSNGLKLSENVGYGGSSEQIFTAYMNSPSHRANILDPDYTHVGIGHAITNTGTIYITQDFMKCKIGSNRVSLCAAGKK